MTLSIKMAILVALAILIILSNGEAIFYYNEHSKIVLKDTKGISLMWRQSQNNIMASSSQQKPYPQSPKKSILYHVHELHSTYTTLSKNNV